MPVPSKRCVGLPLTTLRTLKRICRPSLSSLEDTMKSLCTALALPSVMSAMKRCVVVQPVQTSRNSSTLCPRTATMPPGSVEASVTSYCARWDSRLIGAACANDTVTARPAARRATRITALLRQCPTNGPYKSGRRSRNKPQDARAFAISSRSKAAVATPSCVRSSSASIAPVGPAMKEEP